VQVSNDATYASGVTTVFSNDTNNSAGQGIGGNAEYAETSLGKDIAFPAVSARYVRLWTNGSTANVDNHYVEVEVFGTGGTYAYSQSSYYSYSQSAYVSYAYSQSTYYAYSQSAYTSGTVYNVKTSACGPSGTNAAGNGTTDDGGVIRSCIGHLSSGDKLLFPSGTYLVSGEIDLVGKNNITVDGSSNTATIKGNFSGGSLFVVGNTAFGGQRGTGIALSATANELSTSFTTVSSLGVNPGDYVHLIEGGQGNWNGNNPRACDPAGCRGEVLKVASVNGNTVTVTTALHDTYVPNGGVFSGDGGSTSCSSSNAGNCATAYKLLNPVTAVTVQNINLNGNGTVGNGMVMDETMDSTVSGVGTTGFKYISMFSEGNFNTAWNNVTATNNGNTDSCPPAQEGTGMYFFRVGNPSANGITVSNMVPGTCAETFGIEFTDGVANGTFTNITVDATGAYGRPFKSNALRYSTFNSFTVKNSPAVNNGVSPEYWTSHNTFNNCVVTNNGGTGTGTGSAGIAFFGDYNQYNTFNNCTISGNGNIQVADGPDPVTGPTDIHNTISGGTITGSNSVAPVLYLGVPNFTVSGVTIKGPGTQGLVMDRSSANDCINNNTFSNSTGLTAAISSNSNTNVGSGNILNGLSSNLTPGTCP